MVAAKPETVEDYQKWLLKAGYVKSWPVEKSYYTNTTEVMRRQFAGSAIWTQLIDALPVYDQEYLVQTGYPLLLAGSLQPAVQIKPFDSFLLKTFRRNVLDNPNWEEPPSGGWLLPDSWYSPVGDVIRTVVAVKYLDGVEFLIGKIKSLCGTLGAGCVVEMEAREEGYYAAHIDLVHEVEIPTRTWTTAPLELHVELQVTTQLQEVIRQMLHRYYERARVQSPKTPREVWQWDYKSEEFLAGYLGHILHYLEGMIMEVRDRQTKEAL